MVIQYRAADNMALGGNAGKPDTGSDSRRQPEACE